MQCGRWINCSKERERAVGVVCLPLCKSLSAEEDRQSWHSDCEQRGQEDKREWGRAEGDDQAKTTTVFVCLRLSCDPCFMTWAT